MGLCKNWGSSWLCCRFQSHFLQCSSFLFPLLTHSQTCTWTHAFPHSHGDVAFLACVFLALPMLSVLLALPGALLCRNYSWCQLAQFLPLPASPLPPCTTSFVVNLLSLQSGKKTVKAVLWVSADGLRVVDDKTKVRNMYVSPLSPCLSILFVLPLYLPHHSLTTRTVRTSMYLSKFCTPSTQVFYLCLQPLKTKAMSLLGKEKQKCLLKLWDALALSSLTHIHLSSTFSHLYSS